MARKDLVALYGRLGLIVAAFAFVAAIVMGPLVQKFWRPNGAVSAQDGRPHLRLPTGPVKLAAERQS